MQHLRRFGVLSVIGTITLMPLLVLPAMVGVLVDETAMTEAQAGWSASANFFGGAIIALLMALRMHHLDLRKTAAIGFLVAAAGDLASAYTGDYPTVFLLIRFITGLGAGAAYTAVLASFARLPDTDRGYALFVTLQFIVSGLGLYLLPVFSEGLGASGMYLSIVVLDILGLWLCSVLPGKAMRDPDHQDQRSEIKVLLATATLLGALGFLIFEAAFTAEFTYVERLGVSLAFSDQQIGLSMLVGSLIGIPGAFSIVLLGNRLGRLGPLSFGMVMAMGGLAIMIIAETFVPYLIGSLLIGFSWAFCLPFIQGLLASLDPHGTAVAAGSATSTVGGAIGPGLAAIVISSGNYQHVFLFAIGLLLLALISFFFANHHTLRSQNGV
jgi:predicted MFS family arabinose efflux permease